MENKNITELFFDTHLEHDYSAMDLSSPTSDLRCKEQIRLVPCFLGKNLITVMSQNNSSIFIEQEETNYK